MLPSRVCHTQSEQTVLRQIGKISWMIRFDPSRQTKQDRECETSLSLDSRSSLRNPFRISVHPLEAVERLLAVLGSPGRPRRRGSAARASPPPLLDKLIHESAGNQARPGNTAERVPDPDNARLGASCQPSMSGNRSGTTSPVQGQPPIKRANCDEFAYLLLPAFSAALPNHRDEAQALAGLRVFSRDDPHCSIDRNGGANLPNFGI
jgi:hypothetical protein